jgi:hypothetical protein
MEAVSKSHKLPEHLRPNNAPAQTPYLLRHSGLNQEVIRQAAMIACNDDFALMLFVILASLPLLLPVRSPCRQTVPAAADD